MFMRDLGSEGGPLAAAEAVVLLAAKADKMSRKQQAPTEECGYVNFG